MKKKANSSTLWIHFVNECEKPDPRVRVSGLAEIIVINCKFWVVNSDD